MDPGRLLADYMAEQGEGGQSAGLFGHTLVHLVQKVLSREGGTVGLDLYLTQSDSECALSNLKKRRLYLELRSIGSYTKYPLTATDHSCDVDLSTLTDAQTLGWYGVLIRQT